MSETPNVAELYAAALQAQQTEDYQRAQVLLRQVLALAPEHAAALNSLA